ncbi:hypothetical protein J3R30DRAFT_1351569 [Lentinula aciculospora]|uniref:Uncharacterized protein n=1 Tax=Lentinula aciculospora TaxID=153920 RepID=A0A9W9DUE5_9AGAR|nr:hypothetical protein J3R30DRAFT_1351569 [Lentinula aciculospora]
MFSDSMLTLVVAAFFLAAHAMPHPRLGISTNRTVSVQPKLSPRDHTPVPASEKTNSLKGRSGDDDSRQAFVQEWLDQLTIDYHPGSRCSRYGTNVATFLPRNLTATIADRRLLTKQGNHNRGIFTLRNRGVVKLVTIFPNGDGQDHESAACEVESLKAFGQNVMAGFVTLPNEKNSVGVIIMDKVDGIPFWFTKEWTASLTPKKEKLDLLGSPKNQVGNVIYDLLTQGKPHFGWACSLL